MVKGAAMVLCCNKLTEMGLDLSKMRALEFYAREGDWQTLSYAGQVGSVEAWEIDPAFEAALRQNLPGAQIEIGNSYELAKLSKNQARFDFVVLDNPNGVFGGEGEYCEHFEALPIALQLIESKGVLIFDVNWKPYNYEQHAEWQRRRNAYYDLADASCFDVVEELGPFYCGKIEENGFAVLDWFEMPRDPDHLSYLVMIVERMEKHEY